MGRCRHELCLKIYQWAMKTLLRVRENTSNLVCNAELGYPTLSDILQLKQPFFFHVLWQETSGMFDDPFHLVVGSIRAMNKHVGKVVNKYTRDNIPNLRELVDKVRRALLTSRTSRCNEYKDINPTMAVHDMYQVRYAINYFHRVSFTTFRVSGHSLAIETGRWNRRGVAASRENACLRVVQSR